MQLRPPKEPLSIETWNKLAALIAAFFYLSGLMIVSRSLRNFGVVGGVDLLRFDYLWTGFVATSPLFCDAILLLPFLILLSIQLLPSRERRADIHRGPRGISSTVLTILSHFPLYASVIVGVLCYFTAETLLGNYDARPDITGQCSNLAFGAVSLALLSLSFFPLKSKFGGERISRYYQSAQLSALSASGLLYLLYLNQYSLDIYSHIDACRGGGAPAQVHVTFTEEGLKVVPQELTSHGFPRKPVKSAFHPPLVLPSSWQATTSNTAMDYYTCSLLYVGDADYVFFCLVHGDLQTIVVKKDLVATLTYVQPY